MALSRARPGPQVTLSPTAWAHYSYMAELARSRGRSSASEEAETSGQFRRRRGIMSSPQHVNLEYCEIGVPTFGCPGKHGPE